MFKKTFRARIMEKLTPKIDKAVAEYEDMIVKIDENYFETIRSAEEIRKANKENAADVIIDSL